MGAWKPAHLRRKEEAAAGGSNVIAEAEKKYRQVLNRVFEGNVDPMFDQINQIITEGFSKGKTVKLRFVQKRIQIETQKFQ